MFQVITDLRCWAFLELGPTLARPYWKPLIYESWKATWELVVGQPFARVVVLGAIVITTVVVYRRWKRLEDYWAALRGSAAFILSSALIFALIFIAHVLVITPKHIVDQANRDKEAAERVANDAQSEARKLREASNVVKLDVNEKDPKARADVEALQAQNATLSQRLSDTQKQLSDAQVKLQALEPIKRSLTLDQRERLVTALKEAGSYKIAIRRDPQIPETQDYSDQFEAVFKEAGWMVVSPMLLIHQRAEKGIHVLVHDGKHPPEQANALIKAMIMAGITVTGVEVPALEAERIEMLIGFPEDTMPPSPTPHMATSPH
jgi:hypothetical protein